MLNRFFRFRAEILHQRIRNFCNHPISPVETQIKMQVSSRCSSIVKFKEEMGTSIRLYGGSNSSMSAHVPIQAGLNFGDQQTFYCGFRWIFSKKLIETNIDRKHRSIILIENKSIKCLGRARRAFCGVNLRWIFFDEYLRLDFVMYFFDKCFLTRKCLTNVLLCLCA